MNHSSSSLESSALLTKYLQNIYVDMLYTHYYRCLQVQMPCIRGRKVPFDRFLMEIYTCCMQVICHDWYIYIAGNVTCYDHCDIRMGWLWPNSSLYFLLAWQTEKNAVDVNRKTRAIKNKCRFLWCRHLFFVFQ